MGSTTHIISDKHSILPVTCSTRKVFAPPKLMRLFGSVLKTPLPKDRV